MNKTKKLFEIDNNSPEIQAIKEAIKKTKDKRMYQRYMVILYHLKGQTNKDIAEKGVLKLYPTGKIVMILDNARIHHAKLLESFLQENKDRLRLVFLPPYSPKLNLIEGLWGWQKSEVINNIFYSSVKQIRIAVQGFIDSILKVPSQVIERLCLPM